MMSGVQQQDESKDFPPTHAVAIAMAIQARGLSFGFVSGLIDVILRFAHPFNIEYTEDANERIAFQLVKMAYEVPDNGVWTAEILRLLRQYDADYDDNLRQRLAHKSRDAIFDMMATVGRKSGFHLRGIRSIKRTR